MAGQTVGEKRCGKVRGRATAKGFVLVLLAENRGGNPNLNFSPKNRGFQMKVVGKRCWQKGDKNGLWRKKGHCHEKRAVQKEQQEEISGGFWRL